MCGIAGFVDPLTDLGAQRQAVGGMCAAMLHRGPDDGGMESVGPATLGMRRLSIFDPANGHQPMRTSDGRYTLVFNGAIYNFHELRVELRGHGWSFRTECDTEVLLAGFACWGEEVLGKLRGMYAFAVWDSVAEVLFLARDPFGIKPLYYRQDGGRLLFASEINALRASGVFSAEIDPVGVGDYLGWFAVPAPRTIYKNIVSLRPGECGRFDHGRLSLRSAWSFRSIKVENQVCRSRPDFIEQLRSRLEDSLRAHMLADVPVGAFLSGGLDSAIVTGLMCRASTTPLRTFSIGFDEAGYSETLEAEATARHFGTIHESRILTGKEVAGDIEQLLAACDQPTGDGINTYYVSQSASRSGMKVALSGLGGDELFGGYPSFRVLPRLAQWIPFWLKLPSFLRSLIVDRLRRGDTRMRKLADFLNYARDPQELASLQRRVFPESQSRALLHPDCSAKLAKDFPFHPQIDELRIDIASDNGFNLVSGWEARTYMADVLLRDSDTMSMRHSLELRVPFLDRPLVEWLWVQPECFKDNRIRPKAALAEATADLLPSGLLTRKKRGFTLPFAVWMRSDLRPFLDEIFSISSVSKSGLFSNEPVERLWKGFLSGNDSREWSRVWSLAVLIAFVNRKSSQPKT